MASAREHVNVIEVPLDRVVPLRIAYLFDGDRSSAEVVDHLDTDQARHFTVVRDGIDVACATLTTDERVVAGMPVLHRLRWLGVHPGYRHGGIATALIAHRLQLVADAGEQWAWTSARTAVAGMYIGLGAIPDSHVYLDDGTITHVNVRYGPLPDLLLRMP